MVVLLVLLAVLALVVLPLVDLVRFVLQSVFALCPMHFEIAAPL